jgi:hypothetical protein
LDDNFSVGFRFATGDNNSPVSANQSLGLANQGQGGQFSKYAIWLDRAYLKYSLRDKQRGHTFDAYFGRMENPWFYSEILWDDDLGFDGLALKGKLKFSDNFSSFITAGAFPVFSTELNFSSNRPDKFESTDKYLYAVQGGLDFNLTDKIKAKVGAAYYHFAGVEGELSTPYTPLSASDAGDTDNTRPSFAQKGNTYRPLRNIIPDATNGFGTSNQFQYFGLATPYENVALTGKVDFLHFDPIQISILGEWIKNNAFDQQAIDAVAVNNRGPIPLNPDGTLGDGVGAYEGDDIAWTLGLKVGHAALEKRWAWNAGVAYRYIGSDAVIDGFNDSKFGGGGTNMEGFVVNAAVALSPRVNLGVSWFSADNIAGPPLKSDIFHVNLNAKF